MQISRGRLERCLACQKSWRSTRSRAGAEGARDQRARDRVPSDRTRRCRRRLSGGRFPPAYRLRILKEVDACKRPGDGEGALLRSSGSPSSLLTNWRRQREAGALQAMHGFRRDARRHAPSTRG